MRKKTVLTTLAVLIAFALAACGGEAERPLVLDTRLTDALAMDFDYEGKTFFEDGVEAVEMVSCEDGDTAVFMIDGVPERVRFLGIDTPEASAEWEPWGHQATEFACDKLNNADTIVIERDDVAGSRDTYYRVLAWIWYDERLINLELMELAYATRGTLINHRGDYYAYRDEIMDAYFHAREVGKRIHETEGTDPLWDYSPTPQDITIQTLLENPDEHWFAHVNVEGVVSRMLGPHAYIQQGDYGIFVFIGYATSERLQPGNRVRIENARFVNDLLRRNGWHIADVRTGTGTTNDITVLEEGLTVESQTMTIAAIEPVHYGRLVTFENLTFQSYDTQDDGTVATFTDGAEHTLIVSVPTLVPADDRFDFSTLSTGDTVTLSGILSNHVEGVRLIVTTPDDVSPEVD